MNFISFSVLVQVENSLSTYEPHGCVIVYSVVQRSSFRQAEDIVKYLWRENVTKEKAVILVGNKADLARSRVIPTAEGKALAKSIEAKFIETSSGIQHNVDELLVGILKQVKKAFHCVFVCVCVMILHFAYIDLYRSTCIYAGTLSNFYMIEHLRNYRFLRLKVDTLKTIRR